MTEWNDGLGVGTHSWVIATWVSKKMYLLICAVACGVLTVDRGLPGFQPLTLRCSIGCFVGRFCGCRSERCMMYAGDLQGARVRIIQYGLL